MPTLTIYGLNVSSSRQYADMTYSQFIARLRRFNKSELIGKSTQALWLIWNDQNAPAEEREEHALGEVYLGRIAALAAACCSELRPNGRLDGRGLADFAGQMLSIYEPASDPQFKANVEVPEFLSAFATSAVFGKYNIDRRHAHGIITRAAIIRTLRAQWDLKYVSIQGIIRSWDIASRLNEKHSGGIFDRLSNYLNIHPRDYVRAGFLLYCAAGEGRPVGLIDISGKNLTGEVVDQFNLDQEAINLVANRMARTCEEFREWHDQTNSRIHELYRKFVPHPLVGFPLIKVDRSFQGAPSRGGLYICPSPNHMIWWIQSSVIDAIRSLPIRTGTSAGENLKAELGECLSDYLFNLLVSVCGKDHVIPIDDHVGHEEKHADFILVEGEVAIVVECKTSLGSTLAKSVVAPGAIVELWERLHDAYLQCATTINSDIWKSHPRLSSVKKIASIVSFDEILCPDGPAFNGFAQEVGILANMQLGLVEAISIREFEQLIGGLGIAQLFALIQQKWAANKHDELLHTYYQSTHSQFRKMPVSLAHFEKAASDLFPGIDIDKTIREQER